LVDIESALPGFLPQGTTEGRLKVHFVAKLKIVLEGEPTPDISRIGTRIKLEEGIIREEISPTLPYFGVPREAIEKVVTADVGVEASANHSEKIGDYSDLRVEALVSPTVISEMLKRHAQ